MSSRKFATLKVGSTGPDVVVLQSFLRSMHFVGKDGKRISVDGVYGANTGYAVYHFKQFCQFCGQKVTLNTTCDSVTWALLMGE